MCKLYDPVENRVLNMNYFQNIIMISFVYLH